MTFNIIFQNEHFIVLDKPSLVLTVPSRVGQLDERPCLGLQLQDHLKQQIYPVHRLDYEVQGLVMFALNPKAHSCSNKWFENKNISKSYCALTSSNGGPTEFMLNQQMVWECKILRGKKRAYESIHGKNSVTIATLENRDDEGIFHWELQPITGRSHQLRYELFRHNHPIIGDSLYGSTSVFNRGGIALRAFRIDFSKIDDRDNFDLPKIIESKKF